MTEQPGRASPWMVVHYVDRQPVRRYFAQEADARGRQSALEAAFGAGGLEAVKRIDVDLDLEKAVELAAAAGESILVLVRKGIASGKAVATGPTLFEAFYGFEARGAQIKLRPKTAQFYAEQLGSLMRMVGDGKRVGELTRTEIRGWIDSKPVPSRPHALRAAKAWFRWMLRQEPPLLVVDPTAGMGIDSPIEERKISFLTGPQSAALLAKVDPRARAAVALMLFCGIRHNELHRDPAVQGVDVLRWEDLDFVQRSITVRADVAKTRVARTLRAVPSNIWTWLRKYRKDRGPVCGCHLRSALDAARALAKIPHWEKSILRHTCASHHVAAYGDLSATALLIRHEGDVALLNRRYREGVSISKAVGLAFFKLAPPRAA